MIAAVDVHYNDDASALAVALVFSDFSDSSGYRTYKTNFQKPEDYISGEFYRRELPCIMAVLNMVREEIDIVIIDGYVDLGERPGLGRYLWNALGCKTTVIGVAKRYFRGSDPIKVFRGKSRQPLYITSAGMDPAMAATLITCMSGRYRLPELLKKTDSLSRGL